MDNLLTREHLGDGFVARAKHNPSTGGYYYVVTATRDMLQRLNVLGPAVFPEYPERISVGELRKEEVWILHAQDGLDWELTYCTRRRVPAVEKLLKKARPRGRHLRLVWSA